jgi:hypothetical protein
MAGFDEAWLKAHQARMQTLRPSKTAAPSVVEAAPKQSRHKAGVRSDIGPPTLRPAKIYPAGIIFTLSRPTRLLNVSIRQHWTARKKYQAALSAEIASLVPDVTEPYPFERAVVTVTRHSIGTPDRDGFIGGLKPLIDCLLVRSARHPHGLGFIVDDDPEHLTLVANAVRCRTRGEQRTEVCIERGSWQEEE